MLIINPNDIFSSQSKLIIKIKNYNNIYLETHSNDTIIKVHILKNQAVAFEDLESGLYLTKFFTSFEWDSMVNSPNYNQMFYLVQSNNINYPFGIRCSSGKYLGSNPVIFLKTIRMRWKTKLENSESFNIEFPFEIKNSNKNLEYDRFNFFKTIKSKMNS